jgi:hypothetical protein
MRKKKQFLALLAATALYAAFPSFTFAANRVSEITVDVTLEADGSAYVAQTWNGSFDEGTECYFPVTNLGDMGQHSLLIERKNLWH